MRKFIKTPWPVALFVMLFVALVFAEWWATRNCCGSISFAARASCCAAGRDCLQPNFCPGATQAAPVGEP